MANTRKMVLKVSGMSCSGCEEKIEKILLRQNGVNAARASFSANTVFIEYDADVTNPEALAPALEKAGYTLAVRSHTAAQQTARVGTTTGRGRVAGKAVAADGKPEGAQAKKFNISQFIGVAIILFAIYFIISRTVGFNFIPEVTPQMGYGVLFLVGLLTSLHCVAMCGGINMSQCISSVPGTGTGGAAEKVKPSLLYNSGRVISYTIVGGIVGALGSVISFSGWARGVVAVLSGVFMVVMGLSMLGIFPWLNKITPRMPRFLRAKAGEAKKGKGPFFVGLLNGLMPCGPLQAMQLYALGTGSFFAGALSMFIFSLGTVPLMFGLGAISSMLSSKFTSRMLKVSAALVLVLGLVMVNRGLALSGVNLLPPVAQAQAATDSTGQQAQAANNTVVDGVQNITSKLTSGGYPQITVQAGIPVRWNLQADAKSLNGCNRTLVIPKYSKQVNLKAGDNIIEFTPTETGTIPYSCWMGMIQGRINVVPATGGSQATAAATADPTAATNADGQALTGGSGVGGGCCAASALATEFQDGNIPTENIEVAKVVNGVQEVTITVNDQGYSPAVAVVQSGVKTKIKFVGEKLNSCNSYVYFPDYNGGLDLSADQLESPELTPTQDFTFECSMSMLHGYIKVVDDLNNVNLDEVRDAVSQYVPPAGAGGCCG